MAIKVDLDGTIVVETVDDALKIQRLILQGLSTKKVPRIIGPLKTVLGRFDIIPGWEDRWVNTSHGVRLELHLLPAAVDIPEAWMLLMRDQFGKVWGGPSTTDCCQQALASGLLPKAPVSAATEGLPLITPWGTAQQAEWGEKLRKWRLLFSGGHFELRHVLIDPYEDLWSWELEALGGIWQGRTWKAASVAGVCELANDYLIAEDWSVESTIRTPLGNFIRDVTQDAVWKCPTSPNLLELALTHDQNGRGTWHLRNQATGRTLLSSSGPLACVGDYMRREHVVRGDTNPVLSMSTEITTSLGPFKAHSPDPVKRWRLTTRGVDLELSVRPLGNSELWHLIIRNGAWSGRYWHAPHVSALCEAAAECLPPDNWEEAPVICTPWGVAILRKGPKRRGVKSVWDLYFKNDHMVSLHLAAAPMDPADGLWTVMRGEEGFAQADDPLVALQKYARDEQDAALRAVVPQKPE